MMSHDDAIRILTQHRDYVERYTSFETWLDTVGDYIDDIFGPHSSQSRNFSSLKSDYKISKIGLFDAWKAKENENKFRQRAKHQVSSLINYLQEKKQLDLKEQQRRTLEAQEQQRQQQEKLRKQQQESQISTQERKKEPNVVVGQNTSLQAPKRQNIFMKIGNSFKSITSTAWAIIVPAILVAIGGAYKLGFDNGNAKFDKDKIELAEENRKLKDSLTLIEQKEKMRMKSIPFDTTTIQDFIKESANRNVDSVYR